MDGPANPRPTLWTEAIAEQPAPPQVAAPRLVPLGAQDVQAAGGGDLLLLRAALGPQLLQRGLVLGSALVTAAGGAREVVLPPLSAPPASPLLAAVAPPASESPRVGIEGGMMATLRVDDGFQGSKVGPGFGAEVGLRLRLPVGALAIAVRGTYDQYRDTPNHVVHSLALPLAWRIRSNDNIVIPYVAFVPQLMWETTQGRGPGRALKFVVGGLAGLQANVGPGGFFLEVGYEHRRGQREDLGDLPPGGLFGALGYRFRFAR